jgi:hypothetical protein
VSKHPHDCDVDGDLAYVGHVGAPGYGIAYECKTCGRSWLLIGKTFVDPADGPFELTPEDVR